MDRCRVVVRAAGGMGRVLRTSLTPGVADGASLAVLPPGGAGRGDGSKSRRRLDDGVCGAGGTTLPANGEPVDPAGWRTLRPLGGAGLAVASRRVGVRPWVRADVGHRDDGGSHRPAVVGDRARTRALR